MINQPEEEEKIIQQRIKELESKEGLPVNFSFIEDNIEAPIEEYIYNT